MNQVVLACGPADPATLMVLSVACEHLGASLARWPGTEPPVRPSAIVATLRTGERRIPQDAAALVECYGHPPLVLLAAEPVRESAVELHGGRVVVIGPPLDADRMAGVLRRACRAGTSRGGELVERLRDLWWTARTSATELVENSAGLTVVIAPSRQRDDGAIQLSATAAEWTLWWPHGWSLWLASSDRAPRVADLGGTPAPSPRRLSAHGGDILIAGHGIDVQPVAEVAAHRGVAAARDTLEQLVAEAVDASAAIAMVRA